MSTPDSLAPVFDPLRLRALQETELLDSEAEEAFDRITRMASRLLGIDVALVSLVDDKRQFFKSALGLGEPWATLRETPLTHSFCKHAVASGEPLVIDDAEHHPVVRDNLAIRDLGVQAYAGVPLTTSEHHSLGVLCVADIKPRKFSEEDVAILKELAQYAVAEIERRVAAKRLRVREGLLNALSESTQDGIVTANERGEIIFWNAAAEQLFGYSPDEVLQKPLTMLMPERYRAMHEAGVARVEAGGTPRLIGQTVEIEGLRKSGEEFPIELSLSRYEQAGRTLFTGILRDITERKLRADALRRAEEQLRFTIDHAPIGMTLVDLKGRFLRVNRALCEIVGYTADELIKLTFQEITHPDDLEGDLVLLDQLTRGDIARYQLSKRYIHKNGAVLDIMLYVSVVRNSAGVPQHYIAQIEDVTAKKAAELQLQHQTAILQSVLDHMDDGVVVTDSAGEVLLCNPAAARMVGRLVDTPPDSWSDRYGLYAADGKTKLLPSEVPMSRALRGEQVNQNELFVVNGQNPTGRWHSVNATPLRTHDGTLWGAVTVGRDVTQNKEAEIELRAQTAIIRLFEAVAVASNEANTSDEAMLQCLSLVCDFMGWHVGHVYRVDDARLMPTELWHVSEPQRFATFREITSRTHLSSGLGLPGRVLASARPAWMEDVSVDPSFLRARAVSELGVRGGFAFPVLVGEEVFAVLEFYSDAPARPDARILDVMQHVGTQLGRVVERERHAEAVRNLSLTDELTGLNNRRGFMALVEPQLKLSLRNNRPALLLFIDMDGLKQINDQLGHDAGDGAIVDLANVLRKSFRDSDILARLGGDEFVVLLHDIGSEEDPAFVLHRLQEHVTLHNLTEKRSYVLAVSVGVTAFDPDKPEGVDALLMRADSLMYEQKRRRKSASPRPSITAR